MNIVFPVLGALLAVLFFLNIQNAAALLCRIIGGFAVLFVYNMLSPALSLNCVGINLLSALVTGILGVPGGVLLLCASIFL